MIFLSPYRRKIRECNLARRVGVQGRTRNAQGARSRCTGYYPGNKSQNSTASREKSGSSPNLAIFAWSVPRFRAAAIRSNRSWMLIRIVNGYIRDSVRVGFVLIVQFLWPTGVEIRVDRNECMTSLSASLWKHQARRPICRKRRIHRTRAPPSPQRGTTTGFRS